MKIVIESTQTITQVDGVDCRVWNGRTESGVPCVVFVHMLATNAADDVAEFERELAELDQPTELRRLGDVLWQAL